MVSRSFVVDRSSFAAAHTRGGDFVFVGGVTPHHGVSGELVTGLGQVEQARKLLRGPLLTDAPDERPLAQAWTVYSNLAEVLDRYGAGFLDVARQRLFVRDLRDVPMIERVMEEFFGDNKPATTIVQTPTDQTDPNVSLLVDAVAVARSFSSLEVERINLPGYEDATPGYPQATRVGQFVFFSGTVGINPETGELGTTVAELGAAGSKWMEFNRRPSREQAILTQTWFIYRSFGAVMESLGGSLGDLVKVNGWLTYRMRDCEPMVMVRESLYSAAHEMPASCSIGISAIRPDGALESYDAVGLIPEPGRFSKEVTWPPSDLSPLYVPVLKAGPFVVTCGEVPVSAGRRMPITKFSDLEDEGRFNGYGRTHRAAGIQARAWYVYGLHAKYLDTHGAGFGDVVHQTVFMCNPDDYPALERVACHFFRSSKLPPTTVVPITDTSPYPEAELEIELVAWKE